MTRPKANKAATIDPTDTAQVLALARQDLCAFAVAMVPGYQVAKHVDYLATKLEGIERAQSGLRKLLAKVVRLLLSCPPRHGKSLLLALFCAWYLGKHPDRSVIYATYGQDLSDDVGRRVRNWMTDPLYAGIFPEAKLATDSTSLRRFDLTRGGSFYAVGRGGPITGRGADLLICDDLLKDDAEGRSETIRRGLHEWYGSVAHTRLSAHGAVVIVGTRWSEDDEIGYQLREHAGEGWTLINLQAIAPEAGDPLGRAPGEALWPERYDRETLDGLRRQMGSAAFTSLYLGLPQEAGGALFKREWMRTYSGPLPSFQTLVLSSDTACKTGKQNDYSVITVWGKCNSGAYLLSLWRKRVEFPELRYQLISQAEQWKPHAILIEDAASGQSLIQELKAATPYPVIAVKADKDKISRATAVTPQFEAGRVWLPADAPWLEGYVDELCGFPHAVHDDAVDSSVMALNYMRAGASEPVPFQVVPRAEGSISWLRNLLARPSVPPGMDELARQSAGFRTPSPVLPQVAPVETEPIAAAQYLIAHGRHRDGRPASREDFDKASDLLVWQSLSDVMGGED